MHLIETGARLASTTHMSDDVYADLIKESTGDMILA